MDPVLTLLYKTSWEKDLVRNFIQRVDLGVLSEGGKRCHLHHATYIPP